MQVEYVTAWLATELSKLTLMLHLGLGLKFGCSPCSDANGCKYSRPRVTIFKFLKNRVHTLPSSAMFTATQKSCVPSKCNESVI